VDGIKLSRPTQVVYIERKNTVIETKAYILKTRRKVIVLYTRNSMQTYGEVDLKLHKFVPSKLNEDMGTDSRSGLALWDTVWGSSVTLTARSKLWHMRGYRFILTTVIAIESLFTYLHISLQKISTHNCFIFSRHVSNQTEFIFGVFG
jgi:hypothetical protein